MDGYMQADKARSQAADYATQSAAAASPDFHTAALNSSVRTRSLAQLHLDLNSGPRMQAQQALQRMLEPDAAPRHDAASANRGVAQLVPEKTRITGITHLVRMRDGSIYEGAEVMEVEDGDLVLIDNHDSILSRRGPNQETYRDEDFDGPQQYTWFKVLSVNNFPVGRDVFLRDRTFDKLAADAITDVNPWLIYGTDGRNQQQIAAAVTDGYRRFDCAESYGNSHLVAAALAAQHIPRREVEIIYKFDIHDGETKANLARRLDRAFRLFGGRIDTLLIHNVEGSDNDLTMAWGLMNELKQSGMVREIGLGNITLERRHLIEELAKTGKVDAVENSLSSMLGSAELQEFIKSLGAKPYYYNVIRTAEQIGIKSKAGLMALIANMTSVHDESGMILSSSRTDAASENLATFGLGPRDPNFGEEGNYAELGKINDWQKKSNICDTNARGFPLPPRVAEWLGELVFSSERIREQITDFSHGVVTDATIEQWLVQTGALTVADLAIEVPSRIGLKRNYLKKTLRYILRNLFGSASCDWKWSIQLVQLLVADVDLWDFVADGMTEIVSQ